MLVLWYLEFAMCSLSIGDIMDMQDCLPLIETNGILYEQQCLLRQERRAQCGGEIELVQEHSDHLRVECNGHIRWHSDHFLTTAVPKPTIVTCILSLTKKDSGHVASLRQATETVWSVASLSVPHRVFINFTSHTSKRNHPSTL
jgi:hypothetical protein